MSLFDTPPPEPPSPPCASCGRPAGSAAYGFALCYPCLADWYADASIHPAPAKREKPPGAPDCCGRCIEFGSCFPWCECGCAAQPMPPPVDVEEAERQCANATKAWLAKRKARAA